MTGMPSAQAARADGASGVLASAAAAGFRPSSLRATISQVMISDTPISTPGTMPAMNSLVIETLAATPKMMKAIDGGMTGAMMPPAAIRPAERGTL